MTKLMNSALVVALLSTLWIASAMDERARTMRATPLNVVPVLLYFGEAEAMGVAPEVRWLPADEVNPGRLIEELIQGPKDPRLRRSMSASTRVRSVYTVPGRVTVDFDDAIVRDHPGGSAGEIITVYSVVNTLTELPDVTEVAWRINGEEVVTLVGHMDLSRPLPREPEVIVKP